MQKKHERLCPWLVGLLAAGWLLATCVTLEVGEETPFRSDQFHLEVTLPSGWAAAEGPEYLARPFTGLVAFNSWGEAGFWAPQVTTATSAAYSLRSVLGQIPDGGAYVVLTHFSGGPHLPAEQYGPEHERQDLSGLWQQTDCREGGTATGATHINFFKWGRLLSLEVYCDPNASDTTADTVDTLLASWRFDQVPAGDVGWATVEARKQLPASVQPDKFPLLGGGPTKSSQQADDVMRVTQAEIQKETVVVTFMYRWNEPPLGSHDGDCPADRCHWWRSEARPGGEVVLVEEGGAVLPTGVSTPGATATPTRTPTPSPTPFALTGPHPTDLDVARFIFDRHTPSLGTLTQQFRQELAAGQYSDFSRQNVDVDGDGRPEILFSGHVHDLYLYVAILGRAGDAWQEWLYTDDYGHYCADVRAAAAAGRVTADFLTCGGGTGVFVLTWEQRWIRCRDGDCAVVWSAPLLWTQRLANWTAAREYAVTEVEQPDAETVRLTTRRFGVTDLPFEGTDTSPGTARRVVGPDTVETYRWDGSAYRLESREQTAPGTAIAREFDLLTQETLDLVYDVLSQPFEQPGGSFDGQGFNAARAGFWGLPSPDVPDDPAWGPWHRAPDAAVHNGDLEQVGQWVAGVVGSNDRPLCRLTVQRRTPDGFDLVDRIELPCTANLTRLAWADVTGDGDDELLLLTIPPEVETAETGAGLQRLHVYAVDGGLMELATLDGALNGPDGAGVRWEDVDDDGIVEVLTGLPLVSLEHPIAWPDLARRFQVYRWDTAGGEFTPGEIRTISVPTCTMGRLSQ